VNAAAAQPEDRSPGAAQIAEPAAPASDGATVPVACGIDELRTLFLFEKLTDDQLDWLCRHGRVEVVEQGPVYAEGDPAESFYVLLSGAVVLTRRIGADEIEVTRTSDRGVYGGAFMAYLGDRTAQVYNNSMRVTEPSRFFVLDAKRFAELMNDWFPMAVHLLEGLFFGTKNVQEVIGQRERLLALGSLTAGLTHELNNPAAAAVRATATLRDRITKLRHKLPGISVGKHDAVVQVLVRLLDEASLSGGKRTAPGPLEAADLEDAITDWLDDHDVQRGWELASAFVQADIGTTELDEIVAAVGDGATGSDGGGVTTLDHSLRFLADSVETELLLTEITDSIARISALVGSAKQYSQLDRAPYQVVNVHDLLDSTLAMLSGRIGDGITVVKDYDHDLPRIPCFPSELNQVWTNLVDNAVSAMNGSGTLTIRTSLDRDQVLVDIGDTGPGVPQDLQKRIFEPFFTTKPVGQGTGLGLDISWRIVVTRHHGDLRVHSVPGDTHFQVRLPLTGPTEA
jgi:signal transduction histidine kinase